MARIYIISFSIDERCLPTSAGNGITGGTLNKIPTSQARHKEQEVKTATA